MGGEEFTPARPRLRLESVLRFHRYRGVDEVAPAILEVAREMVALAERLVEPGVVFVRCDLDRVTADALVLKGGPTFHGRCLGAHLAEASAVVCFVATVGPALDRRVEEMSDGAELLEALFLDSAGWLAIEDVVRAFRRHIASRARPGFRLSPRLGPGYVDWPLTEQGALFSLFDGSPIPVTLNEYCVMTPKKSLSGLFGLLPAG